MEKEKPQMDPAKTILVFKNKDGKEVGRKPATATNASAWLDEMARHYGGGTVDYVHDENASLLALLSTPRG